MATQLRYLIPFICFFSCSFFLELSYSNTSTITRDKPLDNCNFLLSENGKFRLTFFKPGKSENRYLGILYNTSSSTRLFNEIDSVWIANRNTPIPDTSGKLEIDSDGRLRISCGDESSIVLSSIKSRSNVSATLQDSGNFILQELNSDGSPKNIQWQSFDHPTNTLLPGMKLGINFKTNHTWSLSSWISYAVPASGSLTLGIEASVTSPRLIVRRHGDIFWTIRPLLTNNQWLNLSFYSNENETYFSLLPTKGNDSVSRYVMGHADLLFIDGHDSYKYLADCFTSPSNLTDGECVQKQVSDCKRRMDDLNYGTDHAYMSEPGDLKLEKSNNWSILDCGIDCRNTCSCVAFASANENGTGCEMWSRRRFSRTKFNGPGNREIYTLGFENDHGEKMKSWIWIVIGVGGALLILLFCCLYYLRLRKLKVEEENKGYKDILSELGVSTIFDKATKMKRQGRKNNELQFFSFRSISAMTNNFSTANKLGEGGFGPVYKGRLYDEQEVAVKRLSHNSRQGLQEFKNEILLIAKLQHTNLVKLFGCCIKGEEFILVYEYMPNKSLDFFLFDHSKNNILYWKTRQNIIEGIAQGLLYLHKYSRLPVIHRDLKASNILLDNQMNPKISDFGMARIFARDESEANTNRVVGTYGYMSPEYAMEGIFSIKSDVFSFGVLLLEIVTGKKNNSNYHSERPLNLIGYAWEQWVEGKGIELIDSTLCDTCPIDEVLRYIHVGLLCVQEYAEDRPTMSGVVSMLNKETMSLSTPKQPAFLGRNTREAVTPEIITENRCLDSLTISEIDAR